MKQQGFTLIEILVALAVFSVMSVLAYGGLEHVLNAREDIGSRTEELRQLQVVFATIKNDLEQSVNRPVRDRLGNRLISFDSKVDEDDIKLAFTTQAHTHWQYENGVSALQRVEYRIEEGKLSRYFWTVLDRAHNTEPESAALLNEIKDIEFEFINKYVHEFWPLPKGHEDYEALPRAVKVTISFTSDKELERLFLVRSI